MTNASGLPDHVWRKSSYSSNNGGDCLEVADGIPGAVPVRDSKTPHAPTLHFTTHTWNNFLTALTNGDLTA